MSESRTLARKRGESEREHGEEKWTPQQREAESKSVRESNKKLFLRRSRRKHKRVKGPKSFPGESEPAHKMTKRSGSE